MQGNRLAQVRGPSLGLVSRFGRRCRFVAGVACRVAGRHGRVADMRLGVVGVGENQRGVVARTWVAVAAGTARSGLGGRRVVGPLRRVTGHIAAWGL
jgi:hypothetical protein